MDIEKRNPCSRSTTPILCNSTGLDITIMPTVKIHKGPSLLETRRFHGNFYIDFIDDILFWRFGSEGWLTDPNHNKTVESVSTQWATWLSKTGANADYYFEFIRPDWSLRVNGKTCERGFYITPTVVWREVELRYRDYIFSFFFRPGETKIDDNAPLPEPDVPASAIKGMLYENKK